MFLNLLFTTRSAAVGVISAGYTTTPDGVATTSLDAGVLHRLFESTVSEQCSDLGSDLYDCLAVPVEPDVEIGTDIDGPKTGSKPKTGSNDTGGGSRE